MKRATDKYAFFTIDVERFVDTECVYKAKQPVKETMLDGLERYLELLDKYNIKATMFVLSDFADEVKDILKKHIDNGHRIALHGKRHIPPKLMEDDQFEEHILQAKEKLESIFKVPVVGYRAPCFSMDRAKLSILEKLGFRYDSSKLDFSSRHNDDDMEMDGFEEVVSDVYRKGNFFEFGLSTQKVFGKKFPVSGGGYLRIANWAFASSMLIKRLKKKNTYVFYLHPFELSKKRSPRIRKLKLYDQYYLKAGMASYPYKIEYIIRQLQKRGYTFATFEDVSHSLLV